MINFSEPLRGNLLSEENKKVADIVDAADVQVQKIKRLVESCLAIQEDGKSVISRSSKRSNHSKLSIHSASKKQYLATSIKSGSAQLDHDQIKEKQRVQYLEDKLSKILANFENQKILIHDLLQTDDNQMMSNEMQRLHEMYEKMVMIADQLRTDISFDQADKIDEIIEREDTKMFEIKKLVAGWMKAQAELEKRSLRSRASKLSSRSGASRRSINKEILVHQNPSNKDNNEDKRLEELLSNQLRKAHKKLDNQKSLINDLLKVNDSDIMSREMVVMEQIHENLAATANRLSEIIPFEAAKSLSAKIAIEDAKMFETKKLVVKWMSVQAEDDDKSILSSSSRQTVLSDMSYNSANRKMKATVLKVGRKENIQEKEEKEKSEPQLKKQLRDKLFKLRLKLENQKSLFKDLVKSNDTGMLGREMQKLQETYRSMADTAFHLHELLPPAEAGEMTELVDTEDTEMFQIKKLVVKQMTAQTE